MRERGFHAEDRWINQNFSLLFIMLPLGPENVLIRSTGGHLLYCQNECESSL